MKIVSIKRLPYLLFIITLSSFQLLDALSTGADLNYRNHLTNLIQNTINQEDQSRLARMIEPLRTKYELNDLNNCYDPNYRNQVMNLFNENFNLQKIVENYYLEEQDRVLKLSSTSFKQTVRTLLENIESIIKQVELCLSGPADKRTRLGFTSLSDWTDDEFRNLLNFKLPNHLPTENNTLQFEKLMSEAEKASIPSEFDLRKNGYVGRVKHQGHCGSCFIFSAVSNVETAYMIQKQLPYDRVKIDLSEQALLDCMDNPNTCRDGGLPSVVWNKMQDNHIFDGNSYPYNGVQNKQNCRKALANHLGIKIGNSLQYYNHPVDDKYLQYFVMQYGAVNVAIEATTIKHLHGKFNGLCPGFGVNHAVTLIGWNTDYWIIKNSWGTNWGVDGFLYLKRGDNRCGIHQFQASAILAQ